MVYLRRAVTPLIAAGLLLAAVVLAGAMLAAVSTMTAIVVLSVIAGAGFAALAVYAFACEAVAGSAALPWDDDLVSVLESQRAVLTVCQETALERWDREATLA
jgi:hypothetical protein